MLAGAGRTVDYPSTEQKKGHSLPISYYPAVEGGVIMWSHLELVVVLILLLGG